MIEKEEEETGKKCSSSSFLELPDELPSVEEALKTLAAALKALDALGVKGVRFCMLIQKPTMFLCRV